MKNKILLICLTVALVAALVGGATMAWFTDSAASEVATFAAGTVIVEANTTMLYGLEYIEGQKGALYEIFADKANGVVTHRKLFDSNKTSLNALAFDRKNNRLYYADRSGNIWFYDFATKTKDITAGKLFAANTPIYNATFGLGYYWFVKEQTDDMYKVSFNPDGTINQVILVAENFTNDPEKKFGFADLVMDMKDGVIFGSTSGLSNSTREFFSYNVYTGDYAVINNDTGSGDTALNVQLAFGADGELYGQVTREYNWYTVNTENGTMGLFYTDDVMFSDLASNYQNNWNPGDCDMLRYYVRNVGTKNNYVRVNLSGSWVLPDSDSSLVSITLCDDMGDWEQVGDYFYYKNVLAPEEDVLLCVKVCFDGPRTDNDYQGATFNVNAQVDAIQASNGASEASGWGWYPQ